MPIMEFLQNLLSTQGEAVENWLDERGREKAPFIYGSVDLRHSGYKIVPVDTNLFPGGFNNLSRAAAKRAAAQMRNYLGGQFPAALRVLIAPENHTRNLNYLENVACLRDIVADAGYDVRVGTLIPEADAPLELETATGRQLVEYPLIKEGNIISTRDGFVPDVIIINNDFTPGVPELLKQCDQPVLPPTGMGWYRRRKRVHFAAYDALARDFAEAFSFDHWQISAYFRNCGLVDFRKREGLECVATNAEQVLSVLRVKYQEYGIKEEPYVYIKADSGTYGMGIMTARSGEEVLAMNKKYRQKMDVIKEGAQNTEVVIQEGVPTIDRVEDAMAEPMIYVVNDTAVGGAFRVNEERDAYNNLNAPGMRFRGMCDEEENETDAAAIRRRRVAHCNFRVYSLISRLATLAAAREEY